MHTWQYYSTFPAWSKTDKAVIQSLLSQYVMIGICSSQYHQLNRVQRHWINTNPSVLVNDKYSYPVFLLGEIQQDLFSEQMQNLFAGSLLLCFFDGFVDDCLKLDLINDFDIYQWFVVWQNLVCVIEKCYDSKEHYTQCYYQDDVVVNILKNVLINHHGNLSMLY